MVYISANAAATPREVFSPINGGLKMTATSYAKPFGGSICPWYADHWDSGSPTSTGSPTDALAPTRFTASGPVASPQVRLPNYSRFPGDQLGLTSALAINSMPSLATFSASWQWYRNIWADFTDGGPNDVLATDNGSTPDIRFMEIAA